MTKLVRCLLAALVLAAAAAPIARADGDPGSDVLVNQSLFAPADANLSVPQQLQLGDVLQAASRSGFPIRVAIIASKDDLGSITPLWLKPSAYARFLGVELSLAFNGRLLVVMPNGFGFNWPGHPEASEYQLLAHVPIGSGAAGFVDATRTAVQRLADAAGVKLRASAQPATNAAASSAASRGSTGATGSGHATDDDAAIVGVVVLALAGAAVAIAATPRLRGRAARVLASVKSRVRPPERIGWVLPGVAVLALLAIAGSAVGILSASSSSSADALSTNPYVDPGTPLFRPAPNFTLTDQFGDPASLSSFRGKVVILAFNDSECTTVCPLTTTAMLDAKAMLGSAASRVQLLGVDANPASTSIEDVWSYSNLHGLLHQWRFLTGSLSQLKRVWREYGIEADIQRGLISHTPALYVVDPQGRLRKLYITQQSYSAVGQFGQVLAREVASLLPGNPQVHSDLSYSEIPGISPTKAQTLASEGGGTVRLGPGPPRLQLFFATWDQEVTSLAGQLEALDRYQHAAAASGLPALTAVDEGSVEPSAATVTSFLRGLPHPLSYPVAVDNSGRLADGYEVQGLPWFVLTSSTGQILWYWEPDTSGWLSEAALASHVRAALARAPKGPASVSQAKRELAGSPAPLAALHEQASRVLGAESALAARVRALRGYPVVINVWASWCPPCRAEFGLFANASAHYGKQIAFVGADADDSLGDAQAFLLQHPVSYPSYQTTSSQLDSILPGGLQGTPTTIFIDRAGKVVYVHTGQYDSQGPLDEDIGSYALGG